MTTKQPPFDYYSMNDVPPAKDCNGEKIWVRTGDGWYRRFVADGSQWRDTEETYYNQAES